MRSTKCELAKPIFERAFREYGLPRAIRTDNGVPVAAAAVYGLSFLNVYWRQLGIAHQRSRPSSPQENGALERMHRTLKRQAIRPVRQSCTAQQRNFDALRREYNAERPHISARPAGATNRTRIGHWEVDTVLGDSLAGACIMTQVERKTGDVMIGKLARRTAANLNARLKALVRRQPHDVRTITADNGTDFHSYKALEAPVPLKFYFATPHHSWERGSNENTNGLIRQHLPKGVSMERLSQADCDQIAARLNSRPRKRFNWQTPEERYVPKR